MFLDCSPNVLGPAKTSFKRCPSCGEWKASAEFGSRKKSRDGLQSRCKKCACEATRRWKSSHPDRARDSNRRWNAKNLERSRGYGRKYRSSNHEKEIERHRIYRESNADKIREYNHRWNRKNLDAKRAYSHNRRARAWETGGTYTAEDLAAIRKSQTDKKGRLICWKCGKPIRGTPHLDHWIPLKRDGSNDAGNLHYMHAKCNLTKNAKHPFEIGRLL